MLGVATVAFSVGHAAAGRSAVGGLANVAACIHATAAGRPWLEKTLWGLYDQERGWAGAEIANRNGTFDLGVLQVNSRWVPVVARQLRRDPGDIRRWLRDDTCFNIGVAAWLFLAGYGHLRDFWRAVGAYHSPSRWRAEAYSLRIAWHLRRRYGATVFIGETANNVRSKRDSLVTSRSPR
jgi:hypothetical protein